MRPVIDVAALRPVGEFGSRPWCEACAECALKMLQAAPLPTDLNWAFTEEYTNPPARLVSASRPVAGYHIVVRDGVPSAGDGVPCEARAIGGFHVRMPWGFICHQSGARYGTAGQRQRAAEERALLAAISRAVGQENPFDWPLDRHGRPSPLLEPAAPWPPAVAEALGAGSEQGNGLHNVAAALQEDSREFAGLPVGELRVPIFERMSAAQRAAFLALCGVRGEVD